MRAIAITIAALAILLPPPATAAQRDRTITIESGGTLHLTVAEASLTAEPEGKLLSILVEPGRSLETKAAQAAAERLFADHALMTAERLGAGRVSIFVRPSAPQPKKRELRSHLSVFTNAGEGNWSLSNRWPSIDAPDRTRLRLKDGTRIAVERSEARAERVDGVSMPTLHAEILLDGLNPMLERDEIYTALNRAWGEVFRPQAENQNISSVELIAHVEPASRRFQMRDATVLQIVAGKEGTFPPLPALPGSDLKPPSMANPAGRTGAAEARFGHIDSRRFDAIVDAAISAPRAPEAESAPFALLSR